MNKVAGADSKSVLAIKILGQHAECFIFTSVGEQEETFNMAFNMGQAG